MIVAVRASAPPPVACGLSTLATTPKSPVMYRIVPGSVFPVAPACEATTATVAGCDDLTVTSFWVTECLPPLVYTSVLAGTVNKQLLGQSVWNVTEQDAATAGTDVMPV